MQYNELQTSRVENLVRRLFGIRNGGIVPTAAPELGIELAVPQLEDVLPLAGYIRYGFLMSKAAVAGQYSYVGVSNLTTSQLMGVQLTASSGSGAGTLYLITAPILAGALIAADGATWLDTRRPGSSLPLNANGIQITSNSNVNVPPGLGISGRLAWGSVVLAATPLTCPTVILAPGTAVLAANGTVNQDITVSGECWLRDILADELVV